MDEIDVMGLTVTGNDFDPAALAGELARKHITIDGETMTYDEAGERFYEMFRGRGENG